MSSTTQQDGEHSCTANLELEYNGNYCDESGIRLSTMSGMIDDDCAVLFMECAKCGAKYDVEYEYREAIRND